MTSVAIALACLPLLATQTGASVEEISELVNDLGSDEGYERREAYRRLSWLGPAVLPSLSKASKCPDKEMVATAAHRLIRIVTLRQRSTTLNGDHIAQWIRQLGHESIEVREKAMQALFEAGNAPLPKLLEATKSDDLEVAPRATIVVEAIRAKRASLRDGEESSEDSARRLLAEGIRLYRKGKLTESHARFEEAFQLKPNADFVYACIKRVGIETIGALMNSPDRGMQDVGRRLVELAKPSGHP